jgi:hypothetical protein
MAKFVSAQFREGPRAGSQILGSGSLREMHRVRSVEETWTTGTGLGFGTQRIKDKNFIGHGGGYPGYITQTLFQPGDRFGVIVLTNSSDGDAGEIARQLIAAVGPLFAKAAVKPSSIAWDPGWARFQGVYRNRSADISIVLLNNRLVALNSTAPGIDAVARLEPLGNGRFQIETPTGNNPPVGEVAWFQEEAGKPVRLYMGDNWSERITSN